MIAVIDRKEPESTELKKLSSADTLPGIELSASAGDTIPLDFNALKAPRIPLSPKPSANPIAELTKYEVPKLSWFEKVQAQFTDWRYSRALNREEREVYRTLTKELREGKIQKLDTGGWADTGLSYATTHVKFVSETLGRVSLDKSHNYRGRNIEVTTPKTSYNDIRDGHNMYWSDGRANVEKRYRAWIHIFNLAEEIAALAKNKLATNA